MKISFGNMKIALTLFLCFSVGQLFAFKIVTVSAYSSKQKKKMNAQIYNHVVGAPKLDCDCYDSDECDYALYEITGEDPESSDEQKRETIEKLDKIIESLKLLKSCKSIDAIGIGFVEGTFIKKSDQLNPEEFYTNKKAFKLDIKRFLERYESKLEEYLPNTTVYIYVNNW